MSSHSIGFNRGPYRRWNLDVFTAAGGGYTLHAEPPPGVYPVLASIRTTVRPGQPGHDEAHAAYWGCHYEMETAMAWLLDWAAGNDPQRMLTPAGVHLPPCWRPGSARDALDAYRRDPEAHSPFELVAVVTYSGR